VAAELASSHEEEKYTFLDGRYSLSPLLLRLWAFAARQLLPEFDRNISQSSGEAIEANFLFQRCSLLVQRFSTILLHNSLPAYDCTD